MRPIQIGFDASNRPLYLTPTQRMASHLHVIGGSGTGKSKFLEQLIREDIRAGHGVCVVDWHGTLFHDLLRWCAWHNVGLNNDYRSLILVDPTQDAFVTPLNFFARSGADVATQVSRRISATVKVWGGRNSDAMPTFERVCRQLYSFSIEQGESLVNAAKLLDFERPDLRAFAQATTCDPHVKAQWNQLLAIRTFREWSEHTLSTANRLTRFVGSHTLKRFLGATEAWLDLRVAMDDGAIVLVNLAESDFLSRDEARVLGALLLNEFFEAAMRRAQSRPRPYTLILDEFQEFITDDLAAMLDQIRKGGLSLVLAHQHLGHFVDNPRLEKAVFTNARNKIVFGALDYDDACKLANELFLHDMNTRQIKRVIYHTSHVFVEQTRTVRGGSSTTSNGRGSGYGSSSGSGASEGRSDPLQGGVDSGFEHPGTQTASRFSADGQSSSQTSFENESDTESWSEIPVWVPIPKREVASEAEWTREEKLSRVAEILKVQSQRHAFVKMGAELTQSILVPFVRERRAATHAMAAYLKALYENQRALTGQEADELLRQKEEALFERVRRHLAPAATEIRPGRRTQFERRRE